MGIEFRDGPDLENGTNAYYEGIERWPECEDKCARFFKKSEFFNEFQKFLHSPRPRIDMTGVKFGAGDCVVLQDERLGIIHFFGRDPRYRMNFLIFNFFFLDP